MPTNTFSSGVNTSFSSQLNTNFAETTKVLATRLLASSTTSTTATTIDTITLTNHTATTAYRLVINFSITTVVGNSFMTLRFSDGSNHTDVEFEVDDNTGSGQSFVVAEIYPGSATSVVIISKTIRDATVPNAIGYHGSNTTLVSSGTWANQDAITIRHRVGTSGTLNCNSYSLQRIGV